MIPAPDPRRPPGRPELLALTLDLCTAVALLDGDAARAWPRVRRAALRYAEAVRAGGLGSEPALAAMRRAAVKWAPRELTAAERARLHERLRFWVGTAFGLRWRTTDDAAASRGAGAALRWPVVACPAPTSDDWERMRAWRDALRANRDRLRSQRHALFVSGEALQARSRVLVAAGVACVQVSAELISSARERLGVRAADEGR